MENLRHAKKGKIKIQKKGRNDSKKMKKTGAFPLPHEIYSLFVCVSSFFFFM